MLKAGIPLLASWYSKVRQSANHFSKSSNGRTLNVPTPWNISRYYCFSKVLTYVVHPPYSLDNYYCCPCNCSLHSNNKCFILLFFITYMKHGLNNSLLSRMCYFLFALLFLQASHQVELVYKHLFLYVKKLISFYVQHQST